MDEKSDNVDIWMNLFENKLPLLDLSASENGRFTLAYESLDYFDSLTQLD